MHVPDAKRSKPSGSGKKAGGEQRSEGPEASMDLGAALGGAG